MTATESRLLCLGALALGLMSPGCADARSITAPVVRIASPLFDPALADSLLESPDRDRWQKPTEIVSALGIGEGSTAADLGAGSGYLLPHLSRAVGPSGRVLAEEVQEAFLEKLRKRASELGNVTVVHGSQTDPLLHGRKVDRFVLLTVYHEVAEPIPFLRALHKYAALDARVAIIDFDAARNGDPPAPVGHELSESAVIAEAEQAGWRISRRHEFLSSQFFLEFRSESVREARD